mmetsp:Transcript_23486/g.41298  ORF Transcript_23486/g.41298 Transcript_23486/m.41298 type:complete len:208 (-) Transcript_23486:64-687(-)
MGNDQANVKKLDAKKLWKEFDFDGSAVLERNELEKLLQMIWKRYGIEKELSKDFVNGIFQELDINKDGRIMQDEFLALFDELWEERHQLFAKKSAGGGHSSGGRPHGHDAHQGHSGQHAAGPDPFKKKELDFDNVRCPFCAFEIDSKNLERLRISPEQLQAMAAAAAPAASSARGAALPPGFSGSGQVPGSYFQGFTGPGWPPQGGR